MTGNVPGGFRLHFLYGLKNRREVIQRKIDRRERGKKLGNLYHARQSDLTEAELQERVDWLLKFFSSGIYDFDPPASRRNRSSFSMESHDDRMKPPTNAMRTRSAADQRATCRPS